MAQWTRAMLWPVAVVLLVITLLPSSSTISDEYYTRHWWEDVNYNNATANTTAYAINEFTQPMNVAFELKEAHSLDQSGQTVVSPATPMPVLSGGDPVSIAKDRGLSDDALMTQASRLTAKMTRISPLNFGEMLTHDAPASRVAYRNSVPSPAQYYSYNNAYLYNKEPQQSASSNARSVFQDMPFRQDGPDEDKSHHIWRFFDNTMNGEQPRNKMPQSRNQDFSSDFRSSAGLDGWKHLMERGRNNQPSMDNNKDDFIDRYIRKAEHRLGQSERKRSSSTSLKAKSNSQENERSSKEDDRVLKFNFARTKKTSEEKKKWNQLIQSIFDNTPRDNYPVSPKTRKYTYSGKSSEENLDGNKLDDILKNEREENVSLDNLEEAEESSEKEDEESTSSLDADSETYYDDDYEDSEEDNQYLKKNSTESTNRAKKSTAKSTKAKMNSKRSKGTSTGHHISGPSNEIYSTTSPLSLLPESLELDSEIEMNVTSEPEEFTTTEEPDLQSLLITKRKPHAVGKWLDSETFELSDNPTEGNMLERRHDIEPDEMPITERPVRTMHHFRKKMGRIDPVSRFVRQDLPVEISESDELSKLAATLEGTPGQDYPIFSSIPRTAFSCSEQQWPGYYADLEAQCQVFHICQTGGRRNSFLCPNGTMFNQLIMTCDWWHNVQCDESPEHYGLNAEIYNFESTRKSSQTGQSMPRPRPNKNTLRRMAVHEPENKNELGESDDESEEKSDELSEVSAHNDTSTSVSETTRRPPPPPTTQSPAMLLTESVFGVRKRESEIVSNDAALGEIKGGGATKGGIDSGVMSKFSRLIQQGRQAALSSNRFKFASHSPSPQMTTPQAKFGRLAMVPVTAATPTTVRGKYYRT